MGLKKIVVFGKPIGGKLTLIRKLAAATNIKVFSLDLIEFKKNDEKVSQEEYSKAHSKMIKSDNWIIEGLGTLKSFWTP